MLIPSLLVKDRLCCPSPELAGVIEVSEEKKILFFQVLFGLLCSIYVDIFVCCVAGFDIHSFICFCLACVVK